MKRDLKHNCKIGSTYLVRFSIVMVAITNTKGAYVIDESCNIKFISWKVWDRISPRKYRQIPVSDKMLKTIKKQKRILKKEFLEKRKE